MLARARALIDRVGRRAVIGVVLLAAAAIVNVAQFQKIDTVGFPRFNALHHGEVSDIIELTYADLPWCRDRFGLPLALAAVAPRARVIIPTPSAYDAHDDMTHNVLIWLRMVRDGPQLARVSYAGAGELLSPAGVDPSPYVIASGKGSSMGAPWLLAVDPRVGPPRGTNPDRFTDRVLAGSRPTAVDGRTFVLLRWGTQRPGSPYAYQDVLLETSLLPDAVRRALGI